MVITSIGLIIVTGGLCLITWLYTSQTKRMANVMAKEYALRVGPIIDVDVKRTHSDSWQLFIRNMGQSKMFLRNVQADIIISSTGQTINVESNSDVQVLDSGQSRTVIINRGRHLAQLRGNTHEIKVSYESAGLEYEFKRHENVIDLAMEVTR